MTCEIQASGTVELYFYGELPAEDRIHLESHLKQCPICRQALDDLSVIRAVLASRPDVASPPGGDWSGFMARLDSTIQREPLRAVEASVASSELAVSPHRSARVVQFSTRRRFVGYLAMAALLAIVTMSVLQLFQHGEVARPPDVVQDGGARASGPLTSSLQADPALVSLSGSHFERSKLVLLGLTTKDPANVGVAEWSRERELATTLLNDTRVYRLAAEERGMNALAGVMRDLELVLLQTSMSEQPDPASLDQLQRLIRRRDLLTKMTVVAMSGP